MTLEFKKAIPREIVIRPSANGGFIVHTGCCEAVFQDSYGLLKALQEYIKMPVDIEKRYNNAVGNVVESVRTAPEQVPEPGREG